MPESVSPRQRRALRLAWQFVRPYRRQVLLALLALVVTAVTAHIALRSYVRK